MDPRIIADRLRVLAVDASNKCDDENKDRQYILEDLISEVLHVAHDLDGRRTGGSVADFENWSLPPNYRIGA